MPEPAQPIERKLAAIFAADVEIMDRLIAEHRGRIANTAGDSVLADFPSVVDAVQCAVEVQQELAEANEGVPPDRRMSFRIGIHVGDVMVRGADLLGDGVNIAARLQGLAEPGDGRHKGQELIVLAKTERDFRRDSEGNYGPHKKSIWVNYRDTEETRAYRREMERLNDFLDQADIEFIPDGLLPKVCPSERTLRRYFSSGDNPRRDDFQRNGRLFGGFWLNLKKGRRKNIRIGGEPVALLDFSSMFVRLAYTAVD